MTDDFESALWKIDRARKHADDLEAEIGAFAETVPYKGEIVGTPESGPAAGPSSPHDVPHVESQGQC